MIAQDDASEKADLLQRLSGIEQEILAMLASGHTVKTIAAHLGRTETSVNERLREARRKTGVSSSRELARLLSSQKTWDKIPVIPPASGSGEDKAARQVWPRFKPKGMSIMIILSAIAALSAYALTSHPTLSGDAGSPVRHATAPKQSPLVGTWSVDVSRLPMPPAERPKRVTITLAVSPGQKWYTRVEIVANDGSVQHAEGTCTADGTPCTQISGNLDWLDSSTLRQPSPNTLVEILGKNGAPVSTRVYTVSRDRRSMTETVMWESGNRIPKMETNYFTRIR